MFFSIDSDTGDAITGWLAPDNPSQIPKIEVRIKGRSEALVEANILRPDVRDLGLHGSGQVGFSITNESVPGLAAARDIEILEADTRTPLYRRFQPDQHIERKLFLFDCSAMPQRTLIESLTPHFSLNYTNSERYSLETMIVLLTNQFSKSIFFTGRSSFSRYANFLESGGYIRAAVLREPLEELAERLLFLKFLSKPNTEHLLPTFATGLLPLVNFARSLDFDNPKALLQSFRQIDESQRQALISPMVRMLGCTLDEQPSYSAVSLALDHLASLDVVGTRERFSTFKAMLEQFIGGVTLRYEPPTTFPTVKELASTLSGNGIVLDLLEHDIALYGYVEVSLATSLSGQRQVAPRDTQTI